MRTYRETLRDRIWRLERQVARRHIEESSRNAARTRLPVADWMCRYLPHYFTHPFSQFHRWLAEELQTLHTLRGKHQVLVAPRGSAKSTWVSLAYPLWVALEGIERYILLISDSQTQARLLLEAFRRE